MQQATRFQRAQQIIKEGYCFTQDKDMDVVYVVKPGRLAASYFIVDGECDCPDAMRSKKPCKHKLAWSILQDEAADEAAMMEAQCKQWEEENPLDCIPTPTLESIAAKDLYQRMSADLQRVEAQVLTHGPRRVNYIQCQQDRNRAAALQVAVHMVALYR